MVIAETFYMFLCSLFSKSLKLYMIDIQAFTCIIFVLELFLLFWIMKILTSFSLYVFVIGYNSSPETTWNCENNVMSKLLFFIHFRLRHWLVYLSVWIMSSENYHNYGHPAVCWEDEACCDISLHIMTWHDWCCVTCKSVVV